MALQAGSKGLHGKVPAQFGGLGVDFELGCQDLLDRVVDGRTQELDDDAVIGRELVQELRAMSRAAGEAGIDKVRLHHLIAWAIDRAERGDRPALNVAVSPDAELTR